MVRYHRVIEALNKKKVAMKYGLKEVGPDGNRDSRGRTSGCRKSLWTDLRFDRLADRELKVIILSTFAIGRWTILYRHYRAL